MLAALTLAMDYRNSFLHSLDRGGVGIYFELQSSLYEDNMTDIAETTTAREPAEDLALIRSMMAAGRKRAGTDGAHLILWGTLLMFAFFLQYASIAGYVPLMGTVLWTSMMVIGWVGSCFLARRTPRIQCEHNIALTGYETAWMAVGITMVLYFATATLSGQLENRTITVLSAAAFGSAFFVISHVLGVKPLQLAAVGWWAVMIYIVQLENLDVEILLVMGFSCGPLILVPGLFLRRLAKSED